MRNFIFKYYKLIILIICIGGFGTLLYDVIQYGILNNDLLFYDYLSKHIINDKMTFIFKIITNLGGVISIVLLTLVLIMFTKDRKLKFAIPINLVLITSLNLLIKNIIQRPRPEGFRLIEESGYSFPSGHSMVCMAFYGFLIYIIFTNFKNKYLKTILIMLISMLIILIGLSRIYLGVHYMSDVLAGFFISISYLIIYIETINKLSNRSDKNEKQKDNK